MELNEFIKQTIIQITDGIRAGHEYIATNKFGHGINDEKYKEISFDIAVATNEEEKTGVGGKISVANIFSAGTDNQAITKASNISRINFKMYLHVETRGQG